MDFKKIIEKNARRIICVDLKLLRHYSAHWELIMFFSFSQNIETVMENRRVSLNRNHISI